MWLEAGKPSEKSEELLEKAEKSIAFIPMISDSISRGEIYVGDVNALPEEKVKTKSKWIRHPVVYAPDRYIGDNTIYANNIASGTSGQTSTTFSNTTGTFADIAATFANATSYSGLYG